MFYTLPLLCNVTFEEVIPLKSFRAVVGVAEGDASEVLGVGLSCTNPDLLSALEAYWWASPPSEGDGSDTRSLAHHVSGNCLVMHVISMAALLLVT